MAIGKFTQVLRKGMTSAPLPGAVTTSTSCKARPTGHWTHLCVTKDGVVEQDAEEHQSQGQYLSPGEVGNAQERLLPGCHPRGVSCCSRCGLHIWSAGCGTSSVKLRHTPELLQHSTIQTQSHRCLINDDCSNQASCLLLTWPSDFAPRDFAETEHGRTDRGCKGRAGVKL